MTLKNFVREESGVMTLWILTWSILFLGFAGLAVDVSNAYRMRAVLQATADSAAHAAAVDYLKTDDVASAKTAAVAFAQANLPAATNGDVVETTDVAFGTWDADAFTFNAGGAAPDAVLVQASRSDLTENKLPVPTSLLRIIDFDSWNIVVAAVATARAGLGGGCDGKNFIIARQTIQGAAGVEVGGDTCFHAVEGMIFEAGAVVLGDDVQFTMGNAEDSLHPTQPNSETGGWAVDKDAAFQEKYGAAYLIPWDAHPDAVRERIDEARAGLLKAIADAALAGTPSTTHIEVPDQNALVAALNGSFTNIYVNCGSRGGTLDLSGLPLTGVTIISECAMKGTGMVLIDTTLMSYDSTGSKQTGPGGAQGKFAINIGTHPDIGPIPADCGTTSPTTLVAIGDIKFQASPSAGDIRIISGGNVSWTAQGDFTNSIQLMAWGKVDMTAHNSIMPCHSPSGGSIIENISVKLVN